MSQEGCHSIEAEVSMESNRRATRYVGGKTANWCGPNDGQRAERGLPRHAVSGTRRSVYIRRVAPFLAGGPSDSLKILFSPRLIPGSGGYSNCHTKGARFTQVFMKIEKNPTGQYLGEIERNFNNIFIEF